MRILMYFGHPAQYLFLRATLKELKKAGCHELTLVIKTKDVLEALIAEDGLEYINILPEERGRSRFSIAWSLVRRNWKLIPIILKKRPQLMIGTDATIAQLGKLFSINRITITEDDYDIVKTLAWLSYPFTQNILCPEACSVGPWEHKKTGYKGYMKLAYLHPAVFVPDASVKATYGIGSAYAIVRLARLTAHHDFGVKGLDSSLTDEIIHLLEERGYRVIISSEGVTQSKYRRYELPIKASDMHQLLCFASVLISDSQSMSVEAAMLGVPSLRLSDFAGRISVLEELEKQYQLTFGFKPSEQAHMLQKLQQLLSMQDLEPEFSRRRSRMLADKINVSAFLTWYIGNYPQSRKLMQENPDSSFDNHS